MKNAKDKASQKRKKRIKRGFKRAVITFVLALTGLLVLNLGWEYVRGVPLFTFVKDRAWMISNAALIVLLPFVAYASVLKSKKGSCQK